MMPDFAGHRLAFVGIGGGSDGIQAAVLALLTGKPACVISIRSHRTSSQHPLSGQMGVERTVHNHRGELTRGVYCITPETTGSGRFLEFIPARDVSVYLVIDYQDGRLCQQIGVALDDFGAVDHVIAVDTGGDALYRAGSTDGTVATPEQDLASLRALSALQSVALTSCIIAPGVDAPPYADDILCQAKARTLTFSAEEQRTILAIYQDYELDGSNPERYGKTPLAWQAALRGERGRVRLPLPDLVVQAPHNPWDPYVTITDVMQGGYVMDLNAHLAAVS